MAIVRHMGGRELTPEERARAMEAAGILDPEKAPTLTVGK